MVRRWLVKYRSLLGDTRLISRIGAFVMVVLAITDGVTVIDAISRTENPGREAVIAASTPVIVYSVVFGIRLYLLYRVPKATVVHFFSWWAAAIGVYFCSDPNPHFYYFRLEHAGLFFVFFSSVTFMITALMVFFNSNDHDSHS